MAVPEVFLQGGKPLLKLSDFAESDFGRRYASYKIVCALPPRWILHQRRLCAPLVLMYFGVEEDREHLLRHTYHPLCDGGQLEAKNFVVSDAVAVAAAIPSGLRPDRWLVVCNRRSSVAHKNLVSDSLAEDAAESIRKESSGLQPFCIEADKRTTLTSTESDALEYVVACTPSLSSETCPSVLPAISLAEPAMIARLMAVLKELRDRALELDPIVPPHVALRPKAVGYTFQANCSTDSSQYRHCVALQNPPWIEPTSHSSDNMVIGPILPQGPGVSFRLYRDAGDALHLCEHFSKHTIDNTDNVLHSDGELVGQVTCHPQGAHFDDLLYFSDAAAPLLRLYLSCPTGEVRRITPVDSMSMALARSPPSLEMLQSFIAAAEAFLDSVTTAVCAGETKFVLSEDKLPPLDIPKDMRRCGWCDRPRERLLRCSACRIAYYCCKPHQANDWKGSHKAECAILKQQAQFYEAHVASRIAVSCGLPSSGAASVCSTWAHVVQPLLRDVLARPILLHLLIPPEVMEGEQEDAITFLEQLAAGGCFRADDVATCLRVVLCCSALPQSARNNCFSINDDGTCALLQPTGALGDSWYEARGLVEDSRHVTVKVTDEKYHHFMSKFLDHHDVCRPNIVVSVGHPNGEGMSYFTAAAEIIGETFLGQNDTKVLVLEPSQVSLRRTQEAIIGRAEMSGKSGACKGRFAAEPGIFNELGFCAVPLEPTRGGVPRHWNMFYRLFQ